MKRSLQHLQQAIGFLTLIPVGNSGETKLGKVLYFFPLVGLLIGAICVGIGSIARCVLIDPLHAAVVLLTSAIVTAGLHLDGLADTFDAAGSWRSKEEKLEIMKDSRVGAMGVIALILILLTKFSALVALEDNWWMGALLAPLWGRWATFYGIHFFAPARATGLASEITRSSNGHFVIASMFTLLVSGFVLWLNGAPLMQQLITPIWVGIVVHLLAWKFARSLGGLTGDTYGAISEFAEVALLLALCSGSWTNVIPLQP